MADKPKPVARKSLLVPVEVYDRLMETAGELNYSHQGKINVMRLLDALSNLEIETLEEILRESDLLPHCTGTDRLW